MMTIRPLLLALAVALPGTAPLAEEPSFEDRVRTYLLENPEVILEALEVLSARQAEAELQARIAAYPKFFEDAPSLGMGAGDAPLRVIEFFDYKCAPCRAMHPVLVDFVEANPEVRVEMRHLPILTPGSERGARFALAVEALHGAALYEAAHTRLWEVRGPIRREALVAIAEELGLDYAALEAEMESAAITERITYNRDAAIDLEVFGTPAFLTRADLIVGTTDIDRLAEAWLGQ